MNWIPLAQLNTLRFTQAPRRLYTLQRWCREGMIPARKIGSEWFVDLDAFDNPEPKENHKVSPRVRSLLDRLRQQGQH